MIELREHEAIGHDEPVAPVFDEGDWEPAESGCMRAMVYGWLGMAIAGAAVIGLLNLIRLVGR